MNNIENNDIMRFFTNNMEEYSKIIETKEEKIQEEINTLREGNLTKEERKAIQINIKSLEKIISHYKKLKYMLYNRKKNERFNNNNFTLFQDI